MADDGPDRDLDGRVELAVRSATSPHEVAERLRRHDDVVAVAVRPGLVKTDPPVVEVLVDQVAGTGPAVRWVYDLVVDDDGGLRLGSRHPG